MDECAPAQRISFDFIHRLHRQKKKEKNKKTFPHAPNSDYRIRQPFSDHVARPAFSWTGDSSDSASIVSGLPARCHQCAQS